jgi:CheY-like chemotaxis protein
VSSTDRPLRVVVVDDDDDFRLMLRVQLNLQDGVEVVGTAGDGREALEVVDELDPDAVAMDLLMPVMDGFAAIGELRERRPEVGVVAYTAVAGRYARERVDELGVELVLKSGDPGGRRSGAAPPARPTVHRTPPPPSVPDPATCHEVAAPETTPRDRRSRPRRPPPARPQGS